MSDRISRDEVGLLIAHAWSLRGTCVRRKVGCLLVDADGYPLGSGYNGPAAGEPHCVDEPCPGAACAPGTGLDRCVAIHAEQNALIQCTNSRKIYTCYVTASPCVHCVKMLMSTSCVRIVFAEEYAQFKESQALWLHATQILEFKRVPLRSWIYLPYSEVRW